MAAKIFSLFYLSLKSLFPSTINYLIIGVVIVSLSCEPDRSLFSDHQVFRYNEYSNISSLDPAFARTQSNIWAVHQLFNGLVRLDDSLMIAPDLAESWTISDDALTYEFHLRKKVFFHKHASFGRDSTREVKASDFVFTFDRLRDEQLASPGRWILNYVEEYSAINDTLLHIKLLKPFPAFLGLLTSEYADVVPEEVVKYEGAEFRKHPIGTGPFQLKLWEENVKVVFRRNPNYFEKDVYGRSLPYLESIAITFLPEKQSAFLQFVQGNIDFISGLDPSYKDELLTSNGNLQLKYQDDVKMLRSPYLNTEYLGFFLDDDKPEMRSVWFRKAVNTGFDREKMMRYLRNNVGIPAYGGIIPKGMPGYQDSIGFSYDPDQAVMCLNKYKEESKDDLPELTIATDASYLDLCEYIQRELEKLGIAVKIDVMPASTLRQSKSTGKLDCFRASWIADYPDAENYLSLFYSQNFAPSGPNYTHFYDTTFDQWYLNAASFANLADRLPLYKRMDSLLMANAAVVPLYYDEVTRFVNNNVHGLEANPINLLELKKVWKDSIDLSPM